MELIRKFRVLLRPRDRRRLLALYCLMVAGAAIEALGVGAIPAFLVLIDRPEMLTLPAVLRRALPGLGTDGDGRLILLGGGALAVFFVAKNAYLAWLSDRKARFVLDQQVAVSERLYRAYLHSPLELHLQRGSAALQHNVNAEVGQALNLVLMPALTAAMELSVLACVVALLFTVDAVASLVAVVLLVGATGASLYLLRTRISRHGSSQRDVRRRMVKQVNQGIDALRDARIMGREEHFVRLLSATAREYAAAARFRHVSGDLPRRVLEVATVAGMLAIAAFVTLRDGSIEAVVPKVALFAFAAGRLMPSINRLSRAVSDIRFHRASVDVVHDDLVLLERNVVGGAVENSEPPPLRAVIVLDRVSYRYPGSDRDALSEVSLTIPRGAVVALVGPSGAGKTTLAGVILGLLSPSAGTITVDGRDLRAVLDGGRLRVGYVPQDVYLIDDTLGGNVTLGLDPSEICRERLDAALDAARLRSFVSSLPDGVDTRVGDDAPRLSRGQRRRVGLARALYRDPDLLVIDEAPSASDAESERAIADCIERLRGDRTVVVIAQRPASGCGFDQSIALEQGRIDLGATGGEHAVVDWAPADKAAPAAPATQGWAP
jgi:ATP-binding cassette subfamily C protein